MHSLILHNPFKFNQHYFVVSVYHIVTEQFFLISIHPSIICIFVKKASLYSQRLIYNNSKITKQSQEETLFIVTVICGDGNLLINKTRKTVSRIRKGYPQSNVFVELQLFYSLKLRASLCGVWCGFSPDTPVLFQRQITRLQSVLGVSICLHGWLSLIGSSMSRLPVQGVTCLLLIGNSHQLPRI